MQKLNKKIEWRCPFCEEDLEDRKEYEKHLCRKKLIITNRRGYNFTKGR